MTRPMLGIIFFALLSLGFTQETTSTDDNNDKSNTVDPPPSVRLDPYIRKALLRALTDLEESESFTDIDTTDATSPLDSDSLNNSEDVTVGEANKENIQIHSFVVNGQAAFANTSNTSPTLIDDKISILGTTVGNVENYVTATLPTRATFNEIFQTRESGINLQQVRSIQSTTKSKNDIAHSKYTTSKSKSSLSTTTTSTTTTTTTPKPTHNDDGENIEDVDKKDVQVFQAPLVAAFTVHQDAQGIPKKVIPIYQQTTNQEILKVSPTSNVFTQKLPIESFPNVPPTEFINQQLTLQRQLEEKQRILEEQLRFLQIQQRQQEELLRNQQFYLQQKEALRQQSLFEQEQLKRQQLLIEQQKLNQVNNNLSVHKNTQQSVSNQNSAQRPQKTQVTILPSLSFDQSSTLAAHQQLPNKEAVDFLINLRRQHPEQFPLQENHLPQGISSFLQPNPIQSFHQAPIIQLSNQIRPTEDQFIQKQGNRVFRHENGVGNFGINNPNYNRYSTFDTTYTNRFVPGNRFSHDAELKQLLAQSSLNSRAHEDLNIVSKVLSLNHGIAINNVSNRLPFDSRRQKRTSS